VLLSGQFGPDGGASLWGRASCRRSTRACACATRATPCLYLSDPDGIDRAARRRSLDTINALNQEALAQAGDPEIATRIAQYELAFKMQASVPELLAIDREPESVREAYGIEPGKVSFGNNCSARAAAGRARSALRAALPLGLGQPRHRPERRHRHLAAQALPGDRSADRRPAARPQGARPARRDARRVGRRVRPHADERGRDGSKFLGRDHHPHAFTIWLAGGGIRRGVTVGATDELGWRITEDPVSAHDLHATLLRLFGFDHEKLVYRFQGRDFRLTDVEGVVVDKLLA
jgi:hypothetical protein